MINIEEEFGPIGLGQVDITKVDEKVDKPRDPLILWSLVSEFLSFD
jgi:hypothetical protein